jgi:hypothetical protein
LRRTIRANHDLRVHVRRAPAVVAFLAVSVTGCTVSATNRATSSGGRQDFRVFPVLGSDVDSLPWTVVKATPASSVVDITYSPGCRRTARPQVVESPNSVTIRVVAAADVGSWWCATWTTVTLHLAAPLGERRLLHAPVVRHELAPSAPPGGAAVHG